MDQSSAPVPYNAQAEDALLGALLLAPARYLECDGLRPEDFYQPQARAVFTAIQAELEADPGATQTITIPVADRLRQTGELEKIGGPSVLTDMVANCPSTGNAPRYVRILQRDGVLRDARTALVEARKVLVDAEDATTALTIINDLFRPLIARTNGGLKLEGMETLLTKYQDLLEARGEGVGLGLMTGWHDLDDIHGGLRGGEFVVVAGRPGMGKTVFGCNLATEAAAQGYQVLYVSLEMSANNLLDRLTAAEARVSLTRIRKAHLDAPHWERIGAAWRRLDTTLRFTIMADPMVTMEQVAAAARRLQDGRPMCIIVDYVQLMKAPKGAENFQRHIADVSGGLKRLALELDALVVGLAQFNRGVEMRDDKRPRLADLKESGALEQDADLVMSLYRHEKYHPDCEARERGVVEVAVLKARNADTGVARLAFLGHHARIANMAQMGGRPAGAGPRPVVDVEPGLDFSEPRDREDVA